MAVPLRPAMAAVASLVAAATMTIPSVAGAHNVDGVRPRLQRVCNRVPRIELRMDRVLRQLDGDETVRGSLAMLEDRQATAEEDGREDRATVLANRLAARTRGRKLIMDRQDEVATLRQMCIDHGVDL